MLKFKFKTRRPYPLLLKTIIVKIQSSFSINKNLKSWLLNSNLNVILLIPLD
jgi:hypothetical protein